MKSLTADRLKVTRGPRSLLQEVSLTIRPGAWTAVVGPNGAGKSTLLRTLAGLEKPAAGGVCWDGKPLSRFSAKQRARLLAWLGQHSELSAAVPVDELVALGRLPHTGLFGGLTAVDRAAINAAFALLGCEQLRARSSSELSGGELQRVLLARCFATEAPVVLLDEPLTYLDPPHQQALVDVFCKRARAGCCVVTVLHDLNLALLADCIVVLADGRVRAQGTAGDPAVQAAIAAVFGGAVLIERWRDRWLASLSGRRRPRIGILGLPTASRLNEFDRLCADARVETVQVKEPGQATCCDWLILPGSEDSQHDLAWLRQTGLVAALAQHLAQDKPLLAICGGLQMLGLSIDDPVSVGGRRPQRSIGLGVLPIRTVYGERLCVRRRRATFGSLSGAWASLSGLSVSGYEVHYGHSEVVSGAGLAEAFSEPGSMAWQQGNVLGLYMHGLLKNPAVLDALFGPAAWSG
jgi:iron complex transport system ATP-binding protein